MTDPVVLMLPGWQDSGPGHWQSIWGQRYGYRRVAQHDWSRPLRGDWIARLQDTILDLEADRAPDAPARIVLLAHSLGCQLTASWAAHSTLGHRILGALLVAPGDPQRDTLASVLHSWSPVDTGELPFPAVVIASRNDPYCGFAQAGQLAALWGARFVDYGATGHINADSGLGEWPDGHARLLAVCQGDAVAASAALRQ